MLSTLSRLLVALVLACSGVVLVQQPAQAVCRCEQTGTNALARAADAVFSGVVLDSGTASYGKRDRKGTAYSIEARTVYQGDITATDVEVISPAGSCSLGDLRTDKEYVFFVTEKGTELRADRCSGTARAKGDFVQSVERALGAGTPLTSSAEPETAVFTEVADAEPESLTRLAAPGAALVLIGLLGLLVVRRAGTRD